MSAGCRSEQGYSLLALMIAVTIMLIVLTAAAPTWRYFVKNDREEELLFRGGEIADAIARYQQRNGNALPASLEVLVKGKFLRHAYKDPMSKDGKWRLLRPGETIGPAGGSPGGGLGPSYPTTTTTTTRPSAFSQPGSVMGGFQGVASYSTDKSLRTFNGRTRYNEWTFISREKRVVGKPIGAPGLEGARGPRDGFGQRPGGPVPQSLTGGTPGPIRGPLEDCIRDGGQQCYVIPP